MKWLENPECWVFDNGTIAEPDGKGSLRFKQAGFTAGGYAYVYIKRRQYYVHRLVAAAYIPNPYNKSQVDHINRDRSDNTSTNLRWATPHENNINKLSTDIAIEKYGFVPSENRTQYEKLRHKNYKEDHRDQYRAYHREYERNRRKRLRSNRSETHSDS